MMVAGSCSSHLLHRQCVAVRQLMVTAAMSRSSSIQRLSRVMQRFEASPLHARLSVPALSLLDEAPAWLLVEALYLLSLRAESHWLVSLRHLMDPLHLFLCFFHQLHFLRL